MSKDVLKAIAGPLTGGISDVVGAVIGAHGQSTAADKQAEAIQKGIDLQREMYQQDRADFAPYRGLGAGAVGNLAYLSGINLPAQASDTAKANVPTTTPMTLQSLGQPPMAPGATQAFNKVAANVNTAEQQYQGPKVKVKSPKTGEVREIPAILLPRATQQGYQQVQ